MLYSVGDRVKINYPKGAAVHGKIATIIAIGWAPYDWKVEVEGIKFHADEKDLLPYLEEPDLKAPELGEVEQEAAPVITIADAFIAASRASQPRYKGQSAAWKSEGKCPTCGELGRYHLSVAICSKHGEY